jgi:signal transduction histidine kinase
MTALRRALVTMGVVAFVGGLITIPITLSSDHVGPRGFYLAQQLLIGWSFVGTGLFMWWRRPENRLGMLMTAVGFTWLLGSLAASSDGHVFFISEVCAALPYAFLVQMLVSFPDGQLHTRLERAVVAATWFDVTIMQWAQQPFAQYPRMSHCDGCPANPWLISENKGLVDALANLQSLFAVIIVAGLIVALVRRSRALAPTQRRQLNPVIWTGAIALVVLTAALTARFAGVSAPVYYAGLFPLAAVPYAFLYGLMQSRLTRAGAVSELVARLSAAPERRGGIAEALADTFDDRSLILAYWLPERGHYVDADGHRVELPESGSGRAWTPVAHEGEPLAAIIHDASLADERELLETAGAAAGLALENERLDAELRARVEELERSRQRLIDVGLSERRKLERNLHDGAQQRLVALALSLRLAHDRLARDPKQSRKLLEESMAELEAATSELRELARGIHPAVLSDRGLAAALNALAGRLPVAVEVVEIPPQRLPPGVEIASYYVVAEALTNVAKYAHANIARVSVAQVNGSVTVEVSDDGAGGADPSHGSGLSGLADRVAALDGRLQVLSAPGSGTTIRAEIPCG